MGEARRDGSSVPWRSAPTEQERARLVVSDKAAYQRHPEEVDVDWLSDEQWTSPDD